MTKPKQDLERPWWTVSHGPGAAVATAIHDGHDVRPEVAAAMALNEPDSLGKAINKLYFQSFPNAARAEILITRHSDDIKAFAKAHGGEIILKPPQVLRAGLVALLFDW